MLLKPQLSRLSLLKPTLTCVMPSASAKTYTSYDDGSSVSEKPTNAGGGSVLKYTAGSTVHGSSVAGLQFGSAGATT